jgi:hypothetical protein
VELEPDACPAGFRLHVAYNAAFDDWAQLSEGAYLLRSSLSVLGHGLLNAPCREVEKGAIS